MAMTLQTDYSVNPQIGFNGQIYGPIENCDIVPYKNVEASLPIPFGRAVVFKTASPVTDFDVLNPAAQTDLVAGILMYSNDYIPTFDTVDINGAIVTAGQLKVGSGLIPGTLMSTVRRGKLRVICESACKPGDRLFVRCTVGTGGQPVGGLGNAADSTKMIDCTKQGVWLSSAAAGGIAVLSFDFGAKP